MNITFQHQVNKNANSVRGVENEAERAHRGIGRAADTGAGKAGRGERKRANATGNGVDVSFLAGSDGIGMTAGMFGDSKEKPKTLTELQQEAANMDVGVTQDYMTVMSHTMSEKDYAELSEEGFHFESMDPEEAVTIVDRIKAELVRSGKQIVGYTDDLDMDVLAGILGSEVLARSIVDAFQAADIPLTQENLESVRAAWDMATQLEAPTEGTYQYMVDNEMEPEIWNLYLAQNSGASEGQQKQIPPTDFLKDEKFLQQIDHVLEQSGYEVNDENRQSANWLLERGLPLTGENLDRLRELSEIEFPVTEENFAAAVTTAVVEGKEAIHADLAQKEETSNPYEKAVEVLERYQREYEENVGYEEGIEGMSRGDAASRESATPYGEAKELHGDIRARRQLEEIRLRMTAEVNVKLVKSGFAIDTAPMEELIDALRAAEKAVAESYFPDDENAVSKYQNWNATNRVMEELPELPAQLLGRERVAAAEISGAQVAETQALEAQLAEMQVPETLADFYAEGKVLRQAYAKAGESYEALMTAPRADLGDSIRKAFANVDDIVRDLGLEVTEENSRAVRILGYNHMEVTVENVNRVKEADSQVNHLIERMTPAATLRMIRDGVNPLEQSFEQLNRYFDELPESFREQAESYSKYLYGLEQSKQITAEERESYIGVYRLLRQIERSDGAVVGAVVNTQAELQFSNLLSAVRSKKFRHMDVKATDELGMLKEVVRKGEGLSISEQISEGYEKQKLEEIRRVAQIDFTAPAMLERGEMPINVENLLAAQGLIKDAGNPFKALREKSERLRGANEVWEKLVDKEEFQEEYEGVVSELQAETEELALDFAETSLDVRSLQLAHKQLSILGNLAKSEEYVVPMYIGDELATVHLTFEQGTEEKGGIFIAVDYAENAHIEAHLQVQNGRVNGFLVGNSQEEVTKLQAATDIFSNLIKENASLDLEAADLPVVSRGNINVTGMSENNSQEQMDAPDNGMLYRVAKLFLQAIR